MLKDLSISMSKQFNLPLSKYAYILLWKDLHILCKPIQPSFVKICLHSTVKRSPHSNLPLSKYANILLWKDPLVKIFHLSSANNKYFLCQIIQPLNVKRSPHFNVKTIRPCFAKICQPSTEKQSHTFSVKQSNLPLSKICQASTEKQSHTFAVKQSNLPLSKICQASTEKQSHTFSVKQPTFLCQKYVKLLLRNNPTLSLSNNQPSFVKNMSSFYWETIPHFLCQTTNLPLSKICQASTE